MLHRISIAREQRRPAEFLDREIQRGMREAQGVGDVEIGEARYGYVARSS
jgi:hypothetical protein